MRTSMVAGAFAAGTLAAALMSQALLARVQTSITLDTDTAAKLQVLLAKEEIGQQIYNYSRALDRMDKDLALQMMHPDGQWNGGTREQFVKSGFDVDSTFSTHSHQMTNSTIKVTGVADGGTGQTRCTGSFPTDRELSEEFARHAPRLRHAATGRFPM
jgi:hypothetical protein